MKKIPKVSCPKKVLCPYCGSDGVQKQRMYGSMSGVCLNNDSCRTWWPWSHRLIVPTHYTDKQIKPLVRVYRKRMVKLRGGRFRIFLDFCDYKRTEYYFTLQRFIRRLSCLFYHSMQTWRKFSRNIKQISFRAK